MSDDRIVQACIGCCNDITKCSCPTMGQAKETRSGSPLESVVQGRVESPVPSKPAVQGTPDILAQLRARAMSAKREAIAMRLREIMLDNDEWIFLNAGKQEAYDCMLRWLDELAQPNNNTAPDTTSGIAGVP